MFAHRQMTQAADFFRQAGWYHKAHPTFAEALGLVRKELWAKEEIFLRVVPGDRDSKSPEGFHGTVDPNALLRSLMAKVEL